MFVYSLCLGKNLTANDRFTQLAVKICEHYFVKQNSRPESQKKPKKRNPKLVGVQKDDRWTPPYNFKFNCPIEGVDYFHYDQKDW